MFIPIFTSLKTSKQPPANFSIAYCLEKPQKYVARSIRFDSRSIWLFRIALGSLSIKMVSVWKGFDKLLFYFIFIFESFSKTRARRTKTWKNIFLEKSLKASIWREGWALQWKSVHKGLYFLPRVTSWVGFEEDL